MLRIELKVSKLLIFFYLSPHMCMRTGTFYFLGGRPFAPFRQVANLKENFLKEMNSRDINDKKKITLLLIGQGFTCQHRLFFFKRPYLS